MRTAGDARPGQAAQKIVLVELLPRLITEDHARVVRVWMRAYLRSHPIPEDFRAAAVFIGQRSVRLDFEVFDATHAVYELDRASNDRQVGSDDMESGAGWIAGVVKCRHDPAPR